VASDLIVDLGPDWILVVGIAGALPAEEFGLGDVLLASRLLDFSVQAAIEGQPPELDASGSRVHPAVEELLPVIRGSARALGPWNTPDTLGRLRPELTVPEDLADERYYGDDSWRLRVRNALRTRFREDRATHRPKLRIGGVASSNTLVKDTQLATEWKSAARSITHIEMELGGVYRAAWKRKQMVPVLSVRGISDVVGFRREGEWTDYACETAASFARALIRSDLPFFDDNSTQSASGIADLSATDAADLPGDAKAVEITWEIDINDFSPRLEEELLGTLSPLVRMSEAVVIGRERVPVKITVAVTDDQILRLLAAASSGRLTAAGIKSIDIVPTDARD
jgi:nucleoside phosphorylase